MPVGIMYIATHWAVYSIAARRRGIQGETKEDHCPDMETIWPSLREERKK
jgi:hypothetical protein